MKKQKLTYSFHDPNTTETAADCLIKIFTEVNAKKVEEAIASYNSNIRADELIK